MGAPLTEQERPAMKRPFLPTPATSLRQRMIEDMTLRGFQDKTQRGYIRIVSAFAEFLGRSPETATSEDVRAYQIHLSQKGLPTPAVRHQNIWHRLGCELEEGWPHLMVVV